MWWVVVVLVCLDAISSQPLTQHVSDAHALVECCPCPGSERATLDALGSATQTTSIAELDRATDEDDCPCRVRDADSDGAPSALLPRVLRPLRPDVKPEDKSDDVKPLLHPEVDLASSVLETLRDATEEEYQEALARDAARNAVKALEDESDHLMVTNPGNADLVEIIVSPRAGEEEDIIISEASHVQESRCAHPLSSLRSDLGQVRSTTPLLPTKGLLRLPKFESKSLSRSPFDMHNSASNVEERVVSANRGLEGLKLKSSPSKLSEFLERAKSRKSKNSNIDETKQNFSSPKVPNFRIDSLLKKQNEKTGLKASEKKVRVNTVNFSHGKTTIFDSVSDLDSNTSPSNIHERYSESLSQKPDKFNLKSFLAKDLKKRPTNLKSILKWKDIEFIPTKPVKTKINITSLNLPPLSQATEDSNLTEPNCDEESSSETSIQKIPFYSKKTNNMKDADFSSSENHSSLIQTEKNISEEDILDDVSVSELSSIQADIGNESLETSNRSEEVHDKENFGADNESVILETNKGDLESSELETGLISREIIKNSYEIEGIDSVELPREDNHQNDSNYPDSFVDASNNDIHFISQNYDREKQFKENDGETKATKNEKNLELEPIRTDDLTLKKKMLQKLEDLKDDIAHIKNTRRTHLISADRSDKDQVEESFESLPKSSEFKGSSQESDMSIQSSKTMKDDSDDDIDMNPSASSSETTILDSVNFPSDPENNPQITDSELFNSSSIHDTNDQLNSNENPLENTCTEDTDKNVEIKAKESNKPNEMSSQASESIPNIVPQPSERQSIIVQPTSLFGDKSLFRPLPDVPSFLNLDPHLPILDEIRSGLSGILGFGARETDDDVEISSEFQSTEDCSGAMSTGASKKSSKAVFPNQRRLEDLNLGIFQLTPKSKKGLFKSRAPGLNLNSYKAKLPLPHNLGLKPIRLESSLGKNGNLIGATLTFGPERIASSKSKMSTSSSILDHARVPNLGSKLLSLPDLGDIKSTMKVRAKDLLNPPLSIAPSHTAQKVSELTDNLRSHTENTVKNIQQSLASTLSETRVKEIPFREKFAKPSPEDLFEKLSTAREDMSDKLKALHADLADRLSSIHENIAERTTLPTLQLPLFTQLNRNSSPKFRTRPKSSTKSKASISNMRSNKAGSSNMRSSASRSTNEINARPFKISKSASTLTPKSVEVPKLMTTTSSKPPFATLQRSSTVKLKDSRPFESSMTVDKKPFSINNVKSIENNPSSVGRPASRNEFGSQRTLRAPYAKDTLRNKANIGNKFRFDDSRGFASEVQPARVLAPVKSGVTVTERIEPTQTQINRSKAKPLFSNQNLGISSQINKSATKSNNDQVSRSLIHKPLPKVGDSPLLSKMRESLLSRHSIQAVSSKNNDDMARSATENKEIEVRQEPLKENVKYRCRMVCVKEPIE